jgi:MoaA/NifB/PqqE/SkfB family radical SAM enzyme
MEIKRIFLDQTQPKYFLVDWMLHDRCTYDCSYCPPGNKKGQDAWLKLDQLKKFCTSVENHARSIDPAFKMHAFFSGGEPTIWKEFPDLVKYLNDRRWLVGVNTNGSRTARWWEENASNFNRIQFSYHTEQVVDDELMEKIKICEYKSNTEVNIMMNPDIRYFDKAVKFTDRLINETSRVHFAHHLIQHNFGGVDIPVSQYTDKQLDIVKNLKGRWNLKYNFEKTSRYLYESLNGAVSNFVPINWIKNGQVNFQNWNCNVGLESIFVDSRGTVSRGTCRVDGNLGSILDPDNIKWPQSSVVCPKIWCGCISDLLSSKEKLG